MPDTNATASFDEIALKAAQQEEEKRKKAVDRLAEQSGETHWVLDVPVEPSVLERQRAQLNVEYVGWSYVDSPNGRDEESSPLERTGTNGRKRYNMSRAADEVSSAACRTANAHPVCLSVG